ncbi:E3 ubiquitin-protein ligase TTC3, partial [Biomphalaria glabrata]
ANMRTSLTESEMEMSEMAEVIFRRCYQLVENKSDLKTILNYIYDVEERSKQGSIDLNFALDEIGNKEIFKSM